MEPLLLSGNIILNEKNEIFLLYKIAHKHLELPGGKVNYNECKDFENPTIEELENTARRELLEEVKGIEIKSMKYFDKTVFDIPDGRKGVGHSFLTRIKGTPEANEYIFDKEKSGFYDMKKLDKKNVAMNVNLILKKLSPHW